MEILIALAIVGLLLAIAIPITHSWLGNRELSENGDRLQADLRQVGQTAITGGIDVNFSGTATGPVEHGYAVWKDGTQIVKRPLNTNTDIRLAGNFSQSSGATAGVNVVFYRNGTRIGGFGYLASGYVVNATGGNAVGGDVILDNGSRAVRIRVARTGAVTADQVNPGTAAANF